MLRGLVLLSLLGLGQVATAAAQDRFDHSRHARLFPSCAGCHRAAAGTGESLWPEPATCTTCHDGTTRRPVSWIPPAEARHSNLRFTHRTHPGINRPGSTACLACHAESAAPATSVRRAVLQQCLDCHGIRTAHLAAGDATCTTCHLPLAQATQLSREDIAGFPAPPSHQQAGFASRGHGAMARAGIASCAVCHARDFCASCHVNAPDQPVIRSLAADPRSLAIRATLSAPASHHDPAFLERHRVTARRSPEQCATCHTRESCTTCHVANPRVAIALPAASKERTAGVTIVRRPPASHVPDFREHHGAVAEATPASCTGCHARVECTQCHRPAAGAAPQGYHPAGFLTRHPAAAYARETSCADCHNSQSFCTSCHLASGFATRVPLGAGYHDSKQFFLMAHGPAARQNLESCVSCHAERDCLSCHAAQGGRRFNPHGPGFDAERLRQKNPEPCTVCHGANIPGAP
jgi:hypothetical protein